MYSSPANAAACTALDTAASAIFEAARTAFSASASAAPSADMANTGYYACSSAACLKLVFMLHCLRGVNLITCKVIFCRSLLDSLHEPGQLRVTQQAVRLLAQQPTEKQKPSSFRLRSCTWMSTAACGLNSFCCCCQSCHNDLTCCSWRVLLPRLAAGVPWGHRHTDCLNTEIGIGE